MNNFQEFLTVIGSIAQTPIQEQYRSQFKVKGEFFYPHTKQFTNVSRNFLEDEKLRTKRKWDNSFKLFLIWFMAKYYEFTNQRLVNPTQQEWLLFERILKLDHKSLKSRWITLINPQMKSTNWVEKEDEFIRSSMNLKNKHIWTQIAVSLYDKNINDHIRTPKQIRERWMNYLNPDLKKDQWLLKEDLIILNYVIKDGKKWSNISQQLSGRTENQVKNRYKSLIHKICKDEEYDEIDMIRQYVRKKYYSLLLSQSQYDSNKQGIVGRRGRQKKGIQKQNKAIKKSQIQKESSDESPEEQPKCEVIQNPQIDDIQQQQQCTIQQQLLQQQQLLFFNSLQQLQQMQPQSAKYFQMLNNFQNNQNEEVKIQTPLMMLSYLPSPGYYLQKGLTPIEQEDQPFDQIQSALINNFNAYKQLQYPSSPFLIQSPSFWGQDAQMQPQTGLEEVPQSAQVQGFQKVISATPFLNPLYLINHIQKQNDADSEKISSQIENEKEKQKQLDFLNVENPIQQFNKRRNLNI